MKYQPEIQRAIWITIALVLTGCASIRATVPATAVPALPAVTPDPTQTLLPSCTGWNCLLEGTVYAGRAGPGNELAGIAVDLSQHSHCSPTKGEQETTTGADGRFSFAVYLHDTDSFAIEVEVDGYEPARQLIGGFDRLYCTGPPIEIVLQPGK